MIRLRFAIPTERAAPPPALDADRVHIWRNHRGGVVALGYRAGGYCWMYWPYLATYRFAAGSPEIADSPEIVAFPEAKSPVDVIWDTYRRSVLPMALQAQGLEALHASAVVSPAGVVAFCAASETGKSTLAFGLRLRGLSQWSDDGLVFRSEGGAITTVPLPFEVRLRAESRRMFRGAVPPSGGLQRNCPGEQIHVQPATVAAICLLKRADSATLAAPAHVRPMTPAEAFPALLAHAHVFDPFDAGRRERMLNAYLDLVAAVPVFEAVFAPIGEQLDVFLSVMAQSFALEPLPDPGAVAVS